MCLNVNFGEPVSAILVKYVNKNFLMIKLSDYCRCKKQVWLPLGRIKTGISKHFSKNGCNFILNTKGFQNKLLVGVIKQKKWYLWYFKYLTSCLCPFPHNRTN